MYRYLLILLCVWYLTAEECKDEKPVARGCYCYLRDLQFVTVRCSNISDVQAVEELRRYKDVQLDYIEMNFMAQESLESAEKLCFLDIFKDVKVKRVVFNNTYLQTIWGDNTIPCKQSSDVKELIFMNSEDVWSFQYFKWDHFLEYTHSLESISAINVKFILIRPSGYRIPLTLKRIQLTATNLDGELSDINFIEKNSNLTTVIIVGNAIKSLQDDVGIENDLETFDLSMNKISKIRENYFERMTNLKTLYLGNNIIPSINIPETMTQLRHLHLDYNRLTKLTLPRSIWKNLESLMLEGNNLKCGPHFKFLFNETGGIDSDCSAKVGNTACGLPNGTTINLCSLSSHHVNL